MKLLRVGGIRPPGRRRHRVLERERHAPVVGSGNLDTLGLVEQPEGHLDQLAVEFNDLSVKALNDRAAD
jgi:hypothetical protein